MDIVIHFQDGSSFSLPVAGTTSIRDLKLKIRELKGIPIDYQHLELNCLRKLLTREDLTLSDYGCRHRDIVNLKTARILDGPHSCTKDGTCFRKFAVEGTLTGMLACLKNRMVVDEADEEGRTALMLAALKGHGEMVHFLIINGASPVVLDLSGRSSIFYGVSGGKADVVTLLLQAGAPVRGTDRRGQTVADITSNYALIGLILKEAEYREALPELLHKLLVDEMTGVCIDIIGHYLNMEGKIGESWSFLPKKNTSLFSSQPSSSSSSSEPTEQKSKRVKLTDSNHFAPMAPPEWTPAVDVNNIVQDQDDDDLIFDITHQQPQQPQQPMPQPMPPLAPFNFQPQHGQGGGGGGGGGGGHAAMNIVEEERWECNKCTFLNSLQSWKCEMCGS